LRVEIFPSAVSGQDGPTVTGRFSIKTGEDFSGMLKGIFSEKSSSASLPRDIEEKKPENFFREKFTSNPGMPGFFSPPNVEPPGEGVKLPEQEPGDSLQQCLPETEPYEAIQPAEEPAGGGEELQFVPEKTAVETNIPEEQLPGEGGKFHFNELGDIPASDLGDIPASDRQDIPASDQDNIPAELSPRLPGKSRLSFLEAGKQAQEAGKQAQQEIHGLEKQLLYGRIPLVDDQGSLTPQARALAFSYLQQGKPLQELHPDILGELQDHPAGMLVLPENETRHIPPASFLSRVENFLRSYLDVKEGEEAVPAAESSIGKQDKDIAMGQGNRYPFLPSEDGEALLSSSGNFKAALEGNTPFYSGLQVLRDPQLYSREIMEQIVERVNYLARPGEQELRLKLQPEFLGEVLIRVRRMKGILSGEIITQHAAIKELLESQMETLRQRFQQVNLDVERFQVFVRDEGRQGFAFAKGYRAGDLSSFADARSGDAVTGETQGLSLELWGEKRRVDYLV
jgi:hypothetical protein